MLIEGSDGVPVMFEEAVRGPVLLTDDGVSEECRKYEDLYKKKKTGSLDCMRFMGKD